MVGTLLLLGMVGGPILPDYYFPSARFYLPAVVCIPAAIALGLMCLRSPARGDRLFGWVGLALGGWLFVAFVLRCLYYLGYAPPLV